MPAHVAHSGANLHHTILTPARIPSTHPNVVFPPRDGVFPPRRSAGGVVTQSPVDWIRRNPSGVPTFQRESLRSRCRHSRIRDAVQPFPPAAEQVYLVASIVKRGKPGYADDASGDSKSRPGEEHRIAGKDDVFTLRNKEVDRDDRMFRSR